MRDGGCAYIFGTILLAIIQINQGITILTSVVPENRPFTSYLVPLFQSKSKWETILMKITLICMKMKLRAELTFI